MTATADPRWGVCTRYRIPDTNNPDITYLARLRLIETPWFGVYLHCIAEADDARALHDHPWNFVTLVLRGGYDESVPADSPWGHARRVRTWRAGTVHRVRRGDFHAITRLHRRPTWTLLLVGRRHDDWGFATPEGWVDHDTYLGRPKPTLTLDTAAKDGELAA